MLNRELGPLTIPVVIGSVRTGRRSHHAAKLVAERLRAADHLAVTLDLKELALPLDDGGEGSHVHPGLAQLRDALEASDASVWLTPEYNHSYTAAIKIALDHLGSELRRKPVMVCGLSSGAMGGVRAVEQLKLVLIELHAVPIRDSVYFSNAGELFDDAATTSHERVIERIDGAIAELAWYASALKAARS
jgi:NAD(P)H-dependent FMN reductase